MATTIKSCVNFSSCSNLILHVHFCSAENDVSEFIVKVETLWGSNIKMQTPNNRPICYPGHLLFLLSLKGHLHDREKMAWAR